MERGSYVAAVTHARWLLWVGVVWIALARRTTPRGSSALFAVLAIVFYILLPVLLNNFGLIPSS